MSKTQLQLYREVIEAALDAGQKVPTISELARAIGRDNESTKNYGLGGRFTYEKHKILVERGLASPDMIAAVERKRSTYEPERETLLEVQREAAARFKEVAL